MRTMVLLLIGISACAGCHQAYYKVTDVQSEKEFYAHGWLPGMYGRYGSMRFRDVRTGEWVSLQSSRAKEVTEDEARRPTTRDSGR